MRFIALLINAALLVLATNAANAGEYPHRVIWGDMHLHTANSGDAFAFGTRLGPEAPRNRCWPAGLSGCASTASQRWGEYSGCCRLWALFPNRWTPQQWAATVSP